MNYQATADLIFDGQAWHEQTFVEWDDSGIIQAFAPLPDHSSTIPYYPGILMPGMINAHCHLELSHLKDKVPTGTTLLPFLKSVVAFRDTDPAFIEHRIREEDAFMQAQGIVAVGDISNTVDTLSSKRDSPIHYHTFVEMFDFLSNEQSDHFFNQYKEVYEAFQSHELICCASPHAPYTVSDQLYTSIQTLNSDHNHSLSIHNQETPHENAWFESGTGDFLAFFQHFSIDQSNFKPTGKTAIHQVIEHLDPTRRTLLVHNTTSTESDIQAAHHWNPSTYWVTCPNANLYIENRLPNYQLFLDQNAKMAIGTDSLTSNWRLSILDEMQTILKYQSYLKSEQVLHWATLSGAQALGIEDWAGSFTLGKNPGIIWLASSPSEPANLHTVRQIQRLDL